MTLQRLVDHLRSREGWRILRYDPLVRITSPVES